MTTHHHHEHDHQLSCKELLGSISDYVEGELSDDLCQEIEKHTAGCDNCRIVIDTLRKTISLYRASGEESAEISSETRDHLFKTLNLEDYMQH